MDGPVRHNTGSPDDSIRIHQGGLDTSPPWDPTMDPFTNPHTHGETFIWIRNGVSPMCIYGLGSFGQHASGSWNPKNLGLVYTTPRTSRGALTRLFFQTCEKEILTDSRGDPEVEYHIRFVGES